MTEQVRVYQPCGAFAYVADAAEADRLLKAKEAKAKYGRDRKVRALYLLAALPVRSEKMADDFRPERPGRHIPVVRMRELIAPSPRRYFGWDKATAKLGGNHVGAVTMRKVRAFDRDVRAIELAQKEAVNDAERLAARRAARRP
jgi:hypothetical protein